MKTEEFNLSEKIGYHNNYESSAFITKEDVKETLQNLQKELKEELEKYGYPSALFLINKLFLKHIGKELLK